MTDFYRQVENHLDTALFPTAKEIKNLKTGEVHYSYIRHDFSIFVSFNRFLTDPDTSKYLILVTCPQKYGNYEHRTWMFTADENAFDKFLEIFNHTVPSDMQLEVDE